MLIKDAEDYSDIADKSTTVLRVWNNPGVVLPSTGGPGTNLIYLLGTILTAFAGVGLVMRKRQRDAATTLALSTWAYTILSILILEAVVLLRMGQRMI